jgi:hypothetical protein
MRDPTSLNRKRAKEARPLLIATAGDGLRVANLAGRGDTVPAGDVAAGAGCGVAGATG